MPSAGRNDEEAAETNHSLNSFDMDLLRPSVVSMKREKQLMNHVLKCFTFGKAVRRDNALLVDDSSRVEEIKSKFNRVKLIRRFFSIKRRDVNRKFDYPVDQLGRIVS